MTQMTNAQARVIDPVLTQVARGFMQPGLVWNALFPRVPVAQRAGRVVTFGVEDFLLYNSQRTPGARTARIQFGHAAGNYSLESHSLEGSLPIELMQEAEAVPGIDMQRIAIQKPLRAIQLRLEKACADLARNAANFPVGNKQTLSGTSQWSDFGATSDPIKDIETAKEAVRARIGMRANTVVMGAAVFAQARQHPKVVDRIKYTSRDVATPELLAALFGVDRVLVGDAVFSTDNAPTFSDVWGKDVIVAYTDPASLADMGSPAFGYTYQLQDYPVVEEGYYDRNTKTWYYPTTDEVQPVISGAIGGFLYTNAVA